MVANLEEIKLFKKVREEVRRCRIPIIEAVNVTSEYPQDGGSVCCCYDYRVLARLKNCAVRSVLHVITQNEITHKMVAAGNMGKGLEASINTTMTILNYH